jgi:hypothetical protein
MKLLFCPHCVDVFNIVLEVEKSCRCGQVKGKYIDKQNAVYSGNPILLGFKNSQFIEASRMNFQKDESVDFTAFTISKTLPSFKKEE